MAQANSGSRGYRGLLSVLKNRVAAARVRTPVAVNQELVLLYWGIGRQILARQRKDGWGSSVIERLANDLRAAFPEMRGLSPAEPWLYEGLCRSVAGDRFASGTCKIAVVPQRRSHREDQGAGAAANGRSHNPAHRRPMNRSRTLIARACPRPYVKKYGDPIVLFTTFGFPLFVRLFTPARHAHK